MPSGMATLLVGGPGSGKTVFALQTLVNAARERREAGLFVAFEEDPRRIVRNAAGFDWSLPALLRRNGTPPRLAFVDARLSPDVVRAGDFDLAGLLARIGQQASAIRARRLVLDGVDVLLAALDDPRRERQEIYRLHRWLSDRGMTAILTAKNDEAEPAVRGRRHGFMDFMVDCLVEMNHRCIDRVSTLSLRVVKFRGARFVPNEAPFTITGRGIAVNNISEDEIHYPASSQRVATGVRRLDAMLGGGYFRGSVTLISGAPGTAKSTLAATYVAAACRRGERALYVSFDEAGSQLVRNVHSVGINLAAHVRNGRLRIFSPRADSRSPESHLLALSDLIHEHRPRHLVLDPVSALLKSGTALDAVAGAQSVVRSAKARGITTVCTSLVGTDRTSESLAMQVSTLADTWIQVSYVMRGGERNRALTIVKSRGTRHSDQLRELILSDRGVTLADAYVVGGDVLMGTARWQAEADERAQRAQERSQAAQRRATLLSDVRDMSARGDALQREIAARRSELASLARDDVSREAQWLSQTRELTRRRGERGETPARRAPRGAVR